MPETTEGRDRHVERAGGELIEEEERLGTLHDEIVDAHGDEVDADRLVHAGLDRDAQLGADAVGRRDEQGSVKPAALRSKMPPKPPIAASAPLRAVRRTRPEIAFTSASPRSISTPASE